MREKSREERFIERKEGRRIEYTEKRAEMERGNIEKRKEDRMR